MNIFPIVFAVLNLLVSVATLAWTLKVMEPLISEFNSQVYKYK